jgi:hypothetical protein
MAVLNVKPRNTKRTHEGAPAAHENAEQQLRRSLMACLLWENSFYEDGQAIADRLCSLVRAVPTTTAQAMAIEARTAMKLRHAPLLIVSELSTLGGLRWQTVRDVLQRADEPGELLAIHWRNGRRRVSRAMIKGIAAALRTFNEYELAKYDRDSTVKLRDVFRLAHPKPENDEQRALWRKVVKRELTTPDTWEVALSAGSNKGETFARLLTEGKLGALALLRNLRNMTEAGVSLDLIGQSLASMKVDRVLPFRFITAARYAPRLEPQLESAMFKCVEGSEKLPGSTVLLVDVSGSMDAAISDKSELLRIDAACGLAILLREIAVNVRVFAFSTSHAEIPARRGFALRDAIKNSMPHSSTNLGAAVMAMPACDRLIVVTDEQSQDVVQRATKHAKAYMVNVASYQNGVGYGDWTRITGWSESIVRYVQTIESESAQS